MLKPTRVLPLRRGRSGSRTTQIALVAFVIQAVFLVTIPASAKSDVAQAREVVETLTDEGLGVLGGTDKSQAKREATFRNILKKYFAFDQISQVVAGRYWRQMSDRQKSDYKRLFAAWTAKTYAVQLGNYRGESVTIDKALPMDDETVVVRTNVAGRDRKFTVEWRIREINGAHKIIDVSVDGISMVATRRSEIASIIQREDIDGLIARLRNNI